MERIILHSDLNNFYASIECLYRPEIRNLPVAVCGSAELRHGIVLAKNNLAKKYGVQTGDTLWQARRKCDGIVFVEPHFDRYLKYSRLAKEIYSEYTDQVEPFGLDECWLDTTGSSRLFGDGVTIAKSIRERMKRELGITVSVGVSFNKVFAKLGSDLKKPDATTSITSENFRRVVWPLPVSNLLYVGRATQNRLKKYGITTIGDLAQNKERWLESLFGKAGHMLWSSANGLDRSPVSNLQSASMLKSVGNSTTTPRDLISENDVKITLYALSESVSARLRKHGFRCATVQLGIRDQNLSWIERQIRLDPPSCTTHDIFEAAFGLYLANRNSKPIRSLGVRACSLSPLDEMQLSIFSDTVREQKQEKLEAAVDGIRNRYGPASVRRGILLSDSLLSGLMLKEEHGNLSR